ncbi:MAG TPA: DNA polymerase III subunit delta [Gemmataceae bacterium]|jgi:DNA polymerase-3 subunit delta|nr:DNA polymerase III subunit delta [Gemmataceae bacterium]
MDALSFIDKNGKTRRQPFYVLSGDEDFLKRRVLALLVPLVLGESDPEYGVTTFPGDKAEFSTVRNELDSVSFFSERRLVVVDQADPFVTNFRPQLEAYVAAPSAVGVLVLDVKAFPATTKLAKAVPEASHIICKGPAEYKLPAWCVDWCQSRYGKKLTTPAAQLLVELVGPAMGVLDQELQKLADFVGAKPAIDIPDVDGLTGRSRGANVFKILDAVGDAKPTTALKILSELFEEGEAPLAMLGALGSQLRKLARTARIYKQGTPIDEAMNRAGVASWPQAREQARKQLKHLGAERLDKLYDWLLETDAGLKGGSPLPDRLQLERLVVRLARSRPN